MAFSEPRKAQITDRAYIKYSRSFAQMGLKTQRFRAIDEQDGRVYIHPDDAQRGSGEPLSVRRDVVEFLEFFES